MRVLRGGEGDGELLGPLLRWRVGIVPYFVYVIAESVLYGWLYNNAQGSLLIVVIFHAMSNTFGGSAGSGG